MYEKEAPPDRYSSLTFSTIFQYITLVILCVAGYDNLVENIGYAHTS